MSLTGLLALLQTNVSVGLPIVSQFTISRIRKDLFNNIAIKPVGSSFAKCSTCNQLQEFILKSPKRSPQYVEFVKQREENLAHQQSCRRLYGAWHEESKRNPSDILCIIQNKMDTALFMTRWILQKFGLGEMYLFKFYVDDEGWPVMKYKKLAVDAQWQPLNRPPHLIVGCKRGWQSKTSLGLTKTGSIQAYVGK